MNSLRPGVALLACGLLGCLAPAPAQETRFQPTRFGAGPLLFFAHSEDAGGKPDEDRDRQWTLYVLDPTSHEGLQVLWRGGCPPPSPLFRLDRNRVLIRLKEGYCVLDLRRGKASAILASENEIEVLAALGFGLSRQQANPRATSST